MSGAGTWFRAAAEDAPSAAALRLQQLNRLVELKRDLEEVAACAEGACQAHELLTCTLAEATAPTPPPRAKRAARPTGAWRMPAGRCRAPRPTVRSRAASLSAALRSGAKEEEAMGACTRLKEAEAGVAGAA
ncbi:MAG: hypothetical protein R3D56_03430 [Paracoccaceae bacterium]